MGIMETKVGPFGLMQLIAIIGGIIGIISIFLTWMSLSGFGDSETFSGLDIITGKDGIGDSDLSYLWAPTVAFVFSIVAVLFALIPAFKVDISKICWIITIISGILMIVMTALWTTTSEDGISLYDVYDMGIGLYLMIVGGILALIGAAIPMFVKSD